MLQIPSFTCDNEKINRAYRYAIACLASNIIMKKSGILDTENPCLMAGNHYDTPWTRDAAINVYNAMAVLSPSISKNTLMSVLEERNGKIVVGDQYWDKIIWSIGAYKVYLVNKDKEFLKFAFNVLKDTIKELEAEEFDTDLNLFRGAAVYGDGVSAYPEKYRNPDGSAGILEWPEKNPGKRYPIGHGIPMKALSTNCVYAENYRIMSQMAQILGEDVTLFKQKYCGLKHAINQHFWNKNKGFYDYLEGESDAQESLGLAMAILFDIADKDKTRKISKNVYITKNGIPCVYPVFHPYEKYGYGRHCGTIWPHIQGFWAKAMLKCGENKMFDHELFSLTENAIRDKQFAEVYHPETGQIYGGIQEWKGNYVEWKSEDYQTWSATAYLNMIIEGIIGLSLINNHPNFKPYLPSGINYAVIKNLSIKGNLLNVEVIRKRKDSIYKRSNYSKGKYIIYVD